MPVTQFNGTARLTDVTGNVIMEEVLVALEDDPASAPSYVGERGWYGEIWVNEGDLLVDQLRVDPDCILELSNNNTCDVRVNSWDDGGRRAQIVGRGHRPY
ncbi:MAG: hypothetical protein ACXVH7_13805 [Thermoanaerobaculia bacterium]